MSPTWGLHHSDSILSEGHHESSFSLRPGKSNLWCEPALHCEYDSLCPCACKEATLSKLLKLKFALSAWRSPTENHPCNLMYSAESTQPAELLSQARCPSDWGALEAEPMIVPVVGGSAAEWSGLEVNGDGFEQCWYLEIGSIYIQGFKHWMWNVHDSF